MIEQTCIDIKASRPITVECEILHVNDLIIANIRITDIRHNWSYEAIVFKYVAAVYLRYLHTTKTGILKTLLLGTHNC